MLGGLALALCARAADAAPAYRLSIAPTTTAEALIELGVQAQVSIVGVSACGDGGHAGVSGALTLEAALKALTAGAPCGYRILDARTVRITAAPLPKVPVEHPATEVGGLTVTATKRPGEVNRLPASISVVGHDQIELTGATGVGDAADQASGVLTTNLGPGRDKLILRGLSDGAFTGRARSTVGSYLDDTPINYNAPDPDLPLVDLDRIEVVRGPQGALYGSGAVSGVYRLVTRKPDLETPAFGLAGYYAETAGGSPSDEVEGYGSLPLVRDRLAVRLVGYHDVEGGYIDNTTLKLSNVDSTSRDGGRAAVRLQITPDWQLDVEAAVQRLRSNDSQYTTPGEPLSSTTRILETHKNDFAEGSATLRGELGWASLRSTVSYIDHVFSSDYDASALQELNELFDVSPTALGVYSEKTRINMLVEDTVLHSSQAGPFGWLAGVYGLATVEKSPSALDVQSPGGPEQIYQEHRRDRVQEAAVYGEADYAFAPRWTVSAGGRLFTTEVRTDAAVQVMAPGMSRTFDGRESFSGFSPKLSIQRAFDGDGLVYALFSEGDRPGGFNTSGIYQIRTDRVPFAADELRNYEMGLKTWLFDHRAALRAAAFFDQWMNIQTDQYRPSGLSLTGNVGDADIGGLEAEADYDAGGGLSLQANLLLTDSRMTRTNPDFATANPGAAQIVATLPGVPKVSGGLLAVYARPLPRGLTFRLIGETSYVGRSAVSFDATNPSTQGGYVRAKLSAQIAARRWTATLFVTNPSDAEGDTFAYGNPFTFGQVRQSTPQRPRTIGLRLTYDQ